MKLILSTIIASLLSFTCSFAQEQERMGNNDDGRVQHLQKETKEESTQGKKQYPTKEEIMSQKIAFFTQELDLTPEEAQKFWPVYNAGYKKADAARKEINSTIRRVHELLKENPEVPESEINGLMEKYFKALDEEDRIYGQTYDELCKVLPVKKAAKTFTLEERFRIMLIKQLRRNN